MISILQFLHKRTIDLPSKFSKAPYCVQKYLRLEIYKKFQRIKLRIPEKKFKVKVNS